MTTKTIHVTQEDINAWLKARKTKTENVCKICAVARAATRAFGMPMIAGWETIRPLRENDITIIETGDVLWADNKSKIQKLDRGIPVDPWSFTVELNDAFIERYNTKANLL